MPSLGQTIGGAVRGVSGQNQQLTALLAFFQSMAQLGRGIKDIGEYIDDRERRRQQNIRFGWAQEDRKRDSTIDKIISFMEGGGTIDGAINSFGTNAATAEGVARYTQLKRAQAEALEALQANKNRKDATRINAGLVTADEIETTPENMPALYQEAEVASGDYYVAGAKHKPLGLPESIHINLARLKDAIQEGNASDVDVISGDIQQQFAAVWKNAQKMYKDPEQQAKYLRDRLGGTLRNPAFRDIVSPLLLTAQTQFSGVSGSDEDYGAQALASKEVMDLLGKAKIEDADKALIAAFTDEAGGIDNVFGEGLKIENLAKVLSDPKKVEKLISSGEISWRTMAERLLSAPDGMEIHSQRLSVLRETGEGVFPGKQPPVGSREYEYAMPGAQYAEILGDYKPFGIQKLTGVERSNYARLGRDVGYFKVGDDLLPPSINTEEKARAYVLKRNPLGLAESQEHLTDTLAGRLEEIFGPALRQSKADSKKRQDQLRNTLIKGR